MIDLSTFTGAATIELGVNDVAVNAASLAISPDGKRLYIGHHEGVSEVDTVTRTVTRTLTSGSGFTHSGLAASPDGRFLYSATGNDVVRFALSTGESKSTRVGGVHEVHVSPDGSRVYVREDKRLRLLDADSFDVQHQRNDLHRNAKLAVHPDGTRLFLTQGHTMNATTLEWSDEFTHASRVEEEPVRIALSPDGTQSCTSSALKAVVTKTEGDDDPLVTDLPGNSYASAIAVATPIG
ncbi:WD40 repeat domain-containing protein [Streptomyces sp. NPDC091377]|uniref:WD40 repeat domain-containing protein n=1 Tax=Streptomyces sp. NPDC091377 TaxID=3365995 RepID=UPI00381F2EBF